MIVSTELTQLEARDLLGVYRYTSVTTAETPQVRLHNCKANQRLIEQYGLDDWVFDASTKSADMPPAYGWVEVVSPAPLTDQDALSAIEEDDRFHSLREMVKNPKYAPKTTLVGDIIEDVSKSGYGIAIRPKPAKKRL